MLNELSCLVSKTGTETLSTFPGTPMHSLADEAFSSAPASLEPEYFRA